MNEEAKRGELIVLSGPSGVGKSTVIKHLLQNRPDIHFSVSFTTRSPRDGEVDGVNYNFVSREEFERMISAGELLEYAQYVNNYYGTSLKVIEDKIEQGIDVLLDIEVQGAATVRQKCPGVPMIFILPPSLEELERRLRHRNTDSPEVIAQRLEKAVEECRQCVNYDYIVVNDSVEHASAEIQTILLAAGCRTMKRIHLAEKICGPLERN